MYSIGNVVGSYVLMVYGDGNYTYHGIVYYIEVCYTSETNIALYANYASIINLFNVKKYLLNTCSVLLQFSDKTDPDSGPFLWDRE